MPKEISVNELHDVLKKGLSDRAILLDVRETYEHDQSRISGALNVPLDELEDKKEALSKYDRIFVHCHSGVRSQKAQAILKKITTAEVINVTGGIAAWKTEGLITQD